MLSRNKKEELKLQPFEVKIFLGELFAECRDQKEVDWLHEEIIALSENIAKDQAMCAIKNE